MLSFTWASCSFTGCSRFRRFPYLRPYKCTVPLKKLKFPFLPALFSSRVPFLHRKYLKLLPIVTFQKHHLYFFARSFRLRTGPVSSPNFPVFLLLYKSDFIIYWIIMILQSLIRQEFCFWLWLKFLSSAILYIVAAKTRRLSKQFNFFVAGFALKFWNTTEVSIEWA